MLMRILYFKGVVNKTTLNLDHMESLAKLIHKTNVSYLPTAFPVHYYGMPDGKIYVVYSRFYEIKFGGSGLEFIFAEHKEYAFDYEKELVKPIHRNQKRTLIFPESVDKPNQKINIFKTCRNVRSYGEAITFLNNEIQNRNSFTSLAAYVS